MTDRDLAQLQLGVYGTVHVDWDYLAIGDVVWGAKVAADGVTDIALRGSWTFEDWIKDFDAFADPLIHSGLGPVHPGFMAGMENAWSEVKAHTKAPRRVIGHSLGAARAGILTGLMVLDKQPPILRVVWGEPKPGFKQLASIVATVPGRSYCNADGSHHHDMVTDVPLKLGIEAYVRATPLIDICAPPPPDDAWGIFAFHHMPLYYEATPAMVL